MSRRCAICGKKAMSGHMITRRGKAKVEGGVGIKITSTTKRKFFANLQKKKVVINGKIKQITVCAKCLKSGKIAVPYQRPLSTNQS